LKLRFWGTRGSIPSPGPETIKYGGNTTCVELQLDDGTFIIFDAGTGIRNLGLEIIRRKTNQKINLFLTHSHWDHIQGFPFFGPANSENCEIKIYGCPPTYIKLREILTNQMESRYFPVNFNELKAQISFETINKGQHPIGNAYFSFVENNHPGSAYGFKVVENGRTFVFMTDNELKPPNNHKKTKGDEFIAFCNQADLLIHDAQYSTDELKHRSGWGHSSYEQTLQLGLNARVKKLVFFHHDPERSDIALDQIINNERDKLKQSNQSMILVAAQEGQEILI
jgi:phosphoribosyl 1,2-cyclic phosphodiesterase